MQRWFSKKKLKINLVEVKKHIEKWKKETESFMAKAFEDLNAVVYKQVKHNEKDE